MGYVFRTNTVWAHMSGPYCIGESKDVITEWTHIDPVLVFDPFSFLFNDHIMKIDILFAIWTDSHTSTIYDLIG